MALLNILEFPDPRLRTVATPVAVVDDCIRQLIDDLLETMYDAPGIGLAATQVNVHKRILVMDVSEEHDQPRAFINPEITVLDETLGQYAFPVPDSVLQIKITESRPVTSGPEFVSLQQKVAVRVGFQNHVTHPKLVEERALGKAVVVVSTFFDGQADQVVRSDRI